MTLMQAVSSVFKNYANFNGRARRSEYWKFFLFNVLVSAAGGLLGMVITAASGEEAGLFITPAILSLYSLATILPGLAVTCRRLHDVGKSGAYIFFFFLPVVGGLLIWVWSVQDGQPWTNQYGKDPKGREMGYGGFGGGPGHSPESVVKASKLCPYCGQKIDSDSVFCSYCGKNTSEKPEKEEHKEENKTVIHKKVCIHCGAMIDQSVKYCPHCGHNTDEKSHSETSGSKPKGGFSIPTDLD